MPRFIAVVDQRSDVHFRNLREKPGRTAGLIKNIRGMGSVHET